MIDIESIKTQEDIERVVNILKSDKRQFAEFVFHLIDNEIEIFDNENPIDVEFMQQLNINKDDGEITLNGAAIKILQDLTKDALMQEWITKLRLALSSEYQKQTSNNIDEQTENIIQEFINSK